MKLLRTLIKTITILAVFVLTIFSIRILLPHTASCVSDILYSAAAETLFSKTNTADTNGSFLQDETETELYSFDTVFYPYYSLLDAREQAVYSAVYDGILAHEEVIYFSIDGLTPEQFTAGWESVLNDHPELFWASGECSYTKTTSGTVVKAELTYCEFSEGLSEAADNFHAAAEAILDHTSALSTDYEKELYIHNALADLIEYDLNSENNQSAYSALVNNSSVCAGYARAFQYLMIESGIPCYYCTGTCGEEEKTDHAWNIAVLDGEYYYVDLTWDDASGSYAFFNRSETDYAGTHTRTGLSTSLPACDGTAYHNTDPMPEEHTPDFTRRAPAQIQGQPQGISGTVPQNRDPGMSAPVPGSMQSGAPNRPIR